MFALSFKEKYSFLRQNTPLTCLMTFSADFSMIKMEEYLTSEHFLISMIKGNHN
jgi:hypothetical protein